MRAIIDTNVVLDYFLARKPNIVEADKLFELIQEEKFEAFATASCVTDIYYIVSKTLGETLARDTIRKLLQLFEIIAIDGQDCNIALDLPMDDFEDALIVACVDKEFIDCIISNDKSFLNTNQQLAKVVDYKGFFDLIN